MREKKKESVQYYQLGARPVDFQLSPVVWLDVFSLLEWLATIDVVWAHHNVKAAFVDGPVSVYCSP